MPRQNPSQVLSPDARKKALSKLKGWTYDTKAKALDRQYDFKDFSAAFAFMTRVAMEAERMSHHPEWMNVYGTVLVSLTTHDEGGVTLADIALATSMDSLAKSVT